jgi:hypothetical protein
LAVIVVLRFSIDWLVAKSCEPLIASVETPEMRPAATLVIVRSLPAVPMLSVPTGATPWKL